MKTKLIFGLLILTTLFVGCKNEKSVDDLEVKSNEVVDNTFKITLKAIVKKQDDFALFFTQDGSINFFAVKPMWQGVKASETEQDIVFTLPPDSYPTQIRFDLGLKADQGDVIIKGIKMTCKGKVFEANGPSFFTYFRAAEAQCTADASTGTVKSIVTKDGTRICPSLYPLEALKPELEKLLK
jgi:hypothetical protein